MFKRNHISVAIAATALLTSSVAFAEQVTSSATVTVQNAFNLAEVAPLNFGVLRVTQPAAQVNGGIAGSERPAYISLPVDGSAMVTTGGTEAVTAVPALSDNASITAITQGTVAEYAITNAAPFSNLRVILDINGVDEETTVINTSIDGVNGARLVTAGGGATEFFTVYADVTDTLIVGGANDGVRLTNAATNLRTDGTGSVGLQLGGVLAYNPAAAGSPNDGVFTGSYTLEVTY
jgi:hypothetical protein